MGTCVSLSQGSLIPQEKDRGIAIQVQPQVQELTYERTAQFLRAAARHPVIGRHFEHFTDSRIADVSQRITVMLSYAFKYGTIGPFMDVLRIHTTMGLTEKDLDAFQDLLLKICYPNQSE